MLYFLGMSSFLVEHGVASAELALNEKYKVQNNSDLTAEKCLCF